MTTPAGRQKGALMRRIMLGLLLAGLAGGPAHAQRRGPPGDCCGQRFDDKTVETLTGQVTHVDRVEHGSGIKGLHLLVKTGQESVLVMLGPEGYVSGQGFSFKAGDKVTVEGSRVQWAGKPAIVAREVTVSGKKLVLRDKSGFPRWAGRGRGGS